MHLRKSRSDMLAGAVPLREFRSYVLAGGASLACEYGLFVLFYYGLGFAIVPANVGAFGIGLLLNFVLNRNWTFRQARSSPTHRQLALYLLAAGFNVAVSTELLVASNHIGVAPGLTKPVIVGAFAVWNYFVVRRFVFGAARPRQRHAINL
jgi:putative flippase GtrA